MVNFFSQGPFIGLKILLLYQYTALVSKTTPQWYLTRRCGISYEKKKQTKKQQQQEGVMN